MVSDRQVRLLRKKRMDDKTLEAAASAAHSSASVPAAMLTPASLSMGVWLS